MRGIKRNFSGGEVSETIISRNDLAKYPTSCLLMQNFIAQLHGGAKFRPGLMYGATALGKAELIPFEFNTQEEDTYVLVFTDLKLRFVQGNGYVVDVGVPVELDTPYTEDDISGLRVTQTGDVVYIVHTGYAQRKLVRTSHTEWALTVVSFEAEVDSPTGVSVTRHGVAGTYTQAYKITAIGADGGESVASVEGSTSTARPSSEWVEGDYLSVSWTAVTEAESYVIYKEQAGSFGFIGTATGTSFRDDNYTPVSSDTPPEANNPFDGGNYPGTVAIHNQRVWYAGSDDNPSTFYSTQVGDFENMNKSIPVRDDDSLEFTLASGTIDQINWMTPFGDLLIGTAGAEFSASGATSGSAITPSSISVAPQSYWGSGSLTPIIIGNSVVHVQRQGSVVRDLFYSFENDGYMGNNLSVLAGHLFDRYKIVSWAYQQTPHSVVWAVRNDGVLLGMTYLKEHQIWGWHRHVTDGVVESVCTLNGEDEDIVYVSVARDIGGETVRYIEQLAPTWYQEDGLASAFFVDSGLSNAPVSITDITKLEPTALGDDAIITDDMLIDDDDIWGLYTPINLELVDHGFTTGDYVYIENVVGMTEINDREFQVTVIDVDNFTLSRENGTDYGDYVSGGDVWARVSSVSGLDHLEGKQVSLLVDGGPIVASESTTVVDGAVDFGVSTSGYKISAGLPYVGYLSPLPFESDAESGTTQGLPQGLSPVDLRLKESVGGAIGVGDCTEDVDNIDFDELIYDVDAWNVAIKPFSGIKSQAPPGQFGAEYTIFIKQEKPLPFTILSIMAEIELEIS